MQVANTDNQNTFIGKRLSEARRFRKMSQQQLASHLDLSFQQIQKYERGETRISFLSMLIMARALNVPVTYFAQDVLPETSEIFRELSPESLHLLDCYEKLPKPQRQALLDLIKTFHK